MDTNINQPEEKSELKETLTDLVGFELTKLWVTIKDLTIRPGHAIAAYCDGDRKKYIPPVTYFLLCLGFSFVVISQSEYFQYSKKIGEEVAKNSFDTFLSNEELNANRLKILKLKWGEVEAQAAFERHRELTLKINSFFESQNGQLVLVMPVALLLLWLFFRKYRRFTHNLFLLLYQQAQISLFTIPFILFFMIFPGVNTVYFILPTIMLFSLGYFIWIAKVFYKVESQEKLILLSIGYTVTSFICYLIWVTFVWVGALVFLEWYI